MNKGYKGLYLKEMKRADESEVIVDRLRVTVERLKLTIVALLVSVSVLTFVVFFRG